MGQGGSTSYLYTNLTRDWDFETIYQSAPISIRGPYAYYLCIAQILGIKNPGSAGRGILVLLFSWYSFLFIWYYLLFLFP